MRGIRPGGMIINLVGISNFRGITVFTLIRPVGIDISHNISLHKIIRNVEIIKNAGIIRIAWIIRGM